MHGLVLRAIQCFLRDIWGAAFWGALAKDLRLPPAGFEAMLSYPPHLADLLVCQTAARLNRSRDSLLEDLGTYLVSHPRREGVRRLLRFGGEGFVDFLHSLPDLPGRLRLAVPDLQLPALILRETGQDQFQLRVAADWNGIGRADTARVFLGLVRAMADDYGALVMIHMLGGDAAGIDIHVLDGAHSDARAFRLAVS